MPKNKGGIKLLLKIENSIPKLKTCFPNDPRGDLEIKFKTKTFFLQKAHLRLFSEYFGRRCQTTEKQITVEAQFKESDFQKILSLMYGHEFLVDKYDIDSYYEIAKFLQITCLIKLIKQDIFKNIEQYNIFVIFALAQKYSNQQLFQLCHEQLYQEAFEQINYQEFQLINLNLCMFKLIIKMHNKFKKDTKKGLDYLEIDAIIRRYCEYNHLHPDMYHTLKFQLIDLNSLSSRDYKKIFLDHVEGALMRSSSGESSFESELDFSTEMKLKMENTFQRKRNSQLNKQNESLVEELTSLKNMANKNKDIHEQMQNQVKALKLQLEKKEHQDLQQKRIITKYESILTYMQGELERKSAEIDLLALRFDEMKKDKSSPLAVSVENNIYVQSQYLPAHLIYEMMGNIGTPTPAPAQSPKKDFPNQKKSRHNSFQNEEEIQMVI